MMNNNFNTQEYSLFFVIVNFGVGSNVLKEAKELGLSGGTIFLGKGTAKNHFLEALGLEEIKKEIVLIVSESCHEDKLHATLTNKFNLDKPNKGIAFSLPLKKVLGSRNPSNCTENKRGGNNSMEHEVIFTIVERGLSEEVIAAATSAGAQGGTIINARGAGSHENKMLFSIPVEPEKEIVIILMDKHKTDKVVDAINKALKIEEPGKGMLFVFDVNKTSGLFNSDNLKK